MTTRVLISFFADDRPGVIEAISSAVARSGGNWLDSRLSRLGGRFAGILQVHIAMSQESALRTALDDLKEAGIVTSMTSAGDPIAAAHATRRLSLLGPDRPGIIRELTGALKKAGFNVQSMETGVESAPMSGEALFRATAQIESLEGSRMDELEAQLDAMAEAMTLEIDLQGL